MHRGVVDAGLRLIDREALAVQLTAHGAGPLVERGHELVLLDVVLLVRLLVGLVRGLCDGGACLTLRPVDIGLLHWLRGLGDLLPLPSGQECGHDGLVGHVDRGPDEPRCLGL